MQIKNWLVRSLLFGAVALIGGAAFPHSVDARGVGAGVGLTVPGHTHCLFPYYGTFYNGCGPEEGTVSLDIPLPVDIHTGNSAKQVYVPVYAESPDFPVGCRGESVGKTLSVTYSPYGGAYVYAPVYQQDTQINLLGNVVPNGGSLLVNCQVGPYGWVEVMGWENRNLTGWP